MPEELYKTLREEREISNKAYAAKLVERVLYGILAVAGSAILLSALGAWLKSAGLP